MVQKIKKTNRQKSPRFFLFFVLFLAVCAAVVLGLLFLKPTFENKGDKSEGSSESTNNYQKSDNKKEEQKEEDPQEITPEAEKSHAQYEGEDPNNLEQITGAISFAGNSDGKFTVNVAIDQALGDDGTCSFNLVNENSQTISGTFPTEPGPTASFCSFSMPIADDMSGNWRITVTIEAEGKAGIITREATL